MSAEGWVYFIQGGDKVKIGWSRNVALRLSQLQTASADELVLLGCMPGTQETERRIHEAFSALRVRGEWFRAEAGLVAGARWMCQEANGAASYSQCETRRRWSDALDICAGTIRRAPASLGSPDEAVHREVSALLGVIQRFLWSFKWAGSRGIAVDVVPGMVARWARQRAEQSPSTDLAAATLDALESLGGGVS